MENLRRNFSDKFLDRVNRLGEIIPVNDERFYLIFKSWEKAAEVTLKKSGSITVKEMVVSNYNPMALNFHGIVESDCVEGEALWVLKQIKDSKVGS